MHDLNARIKMISFNMLDAAERIVDELAHDPVRALPPPPVHAARRQLANMLRLSHFCARATCRRSGCCRGEPLDCLRAAMPLLPLDAFAYLTEQRTRPCARQRHGTTAVSR